MKKTILILGIFALLTLAGCLNGSEDTTTTQESTTTTIQETTTTQETTTSTTVPDISPSDLKDCKKAGTWLDYFNKTDIEYDADRAPVDLDNISPIDSPLKKNLADAKIYSIPFSIAGGDVLTNPFLEISGLYCPFTLRNAQVLFKPIRSKSEALNYTTFLKITLAGSQYGRDHKVIEQKEDYDDFNKQCRDVNISNLSSQDRRITKVKSAENGFIVDLVTFTHSGNAGVYQKKFKISREGRLSTVGETKLILDCGAGLMY